MPATITTLVPKWRKRLIAGRDHIKQLFFKGKHTHAILTLNKQLIDVLLIEIWQTLNLPEKAALIAVGGYGRGELYPYSDVDLLILLDHPAKPAEEQALTQLIGIFWDIGLEVGTSVRTLDECIVAAKDDITILTNLLESRFLAGNHVTFTHFKQQYQQLFDPRSFFEGKLLEQNQRHARYNDSAYQLEPNIKESPGGLRDLHNLRWLAIAAGIGSKWTDLVHAGLLSHTELRQIQNLARFLAELRVRLHYLAGRREDRLLFDFQHSLAGQYQIVSTSTRRASELLMQRYYRNVKALAQLRDILLPNLRACIVASPPNSTPLNPRFNNNNQLLCAVDQSVFERDPSAIFECFLLLEHHHELRGMSAPTLRSLWRASKHINDAFRRNPVHQAQFMEILRSPSGVTRALRNMNHYGILGRYIPAFGRIVGQMQHDLYHIYTVDEHTLAVLRNLRRLTIAELAHEHPLASRLMATFERPEVLYLSALFHDIAKGRGGDHAILGMVDARKFCHLHQLPPEDTELIVWLVGEHLNLSATAQKQDLSDPEVIAHFTAHIPDERHLVALYLLTNCDIRGTSPKVWNAWKAKLLADLFYASQRLLRGDTITGNPLSSTQQQAADLLRLYGLRPHIEDPLWSQLTDTYFLRHDAKEVAWHTRQLWHCVDTKTAIVRARLSPLGEGIQVMIYAPDEDSLFAQICGFFEDVNYTIVDAKIHTARNGYVLDSFVILDKHQRSMPYRDFLSYIEHELAKRLNAKTPLKQSTRGRISRHLKHFPIMPEVSLRADENNKFFLLNLVAGDRPGLLFAIAQVLYQHQVSVYTAKISTLGERAEDTFTLHSNSLNQIQQRIRLETDLMKVLNI
ncbi:[protein-PII] uridylyltransferase [Sulfuriferula nivalis]|uniref:Bifunctional uridylyltransferase/uridylyl-removing enzyme n=1 Tax=Sulfuriferula nivalis TaxID=2675298 RepID=A0A809RIY3_9PROT|nr:[protein-PII] uridylyltransferase [Sulfuriferula nivalis]BBP01556.1 bifunctional uridylyltransferase/uridylyl-removing enzyme [Sulfuriferula nivalis]